jgi:hypothetical protein
MRRLVAVVLLVGLGVFVDVGCRSEPVIDGKKVSDWIGMLRRDEWGVRSNASDALARLGPPALPYLERALASKDPAVRQGVVGALGKMGPTAQDVVPQLLKGISRENIVAIRAEILKALQAIAPDAPGVPEEFKKRLRDIDPEVREIARQALERLEQKREPAKTVAPVAPEKKFGDEGMTFELRQAVANEIAQAKPGADFALIAEVARGAKRAVVVWPGIKNGSLQDGDIVAYVFERGAANTWHKAAGPLKLSVAGAGSVSLAEALGGADGQQVIRPCGVPRATLAEYLTQHAKALKDALSAHKVPEAIAAYEDFLKAFSFSLAAFSATIPELLIKGAFDTPLQLTALQTSDSAVVTITIDKKPQNVQVSIRPCGGNWVVTEFKL